MYTVNYSVDIYDSSTSETTTHTGTLYSPRLVEDGYIIFSPKLTLEVNKAGSFTFTIRPDHPEYSYIRDMATTIIVYRNTEIIFEGRILTSKKDFYNNRSVDCEGCLAYLLDSVISPYSFTQDTGTSSVIKKTISQYIEWLLGKHQDETGLNRELSVGTVDGYGSTLYSFSNDSYSTTWDEIDAQILSVYGGTIVITFGATVSGVVDPERPVFNLYKTAPDYGENDSPQQIQYGENLLDLSTEFSADDLFTVLVPLGKDSDGNTITISSVNQGKIELVDTTLSQQYGRIWKTVTFDDATTASDVKTLGQEVLDQASTIFQTSWSIKAADLKDLGADVDRIKLGYNIQVVSVPHGLTTTDDKFQCTKISLDFSKPESDSYEFGMTKTGLTDQQSTASKDLTIVSAVASSAASTASLAASAVSVVSTRVDNIRQLPSVSSTDNGKILRVVDGAWSLVSISSWSGGSY